MTPRRVDSGQGIAWISEAVQLLRRNPAPFALMGLVIGAVLLVPVLGALAMAVFGPALYGGIMFAAREQDAGRQADFQHLFAAFREPGKLGPMVMLCLPGILGGMLVLMLGVMLLGGALLAAGVGAATDSNALTGISFGFGGVVFLLLALVIGLISYALVFFATPRVMLDGIEPITAMKESLAACQHNAGAVLVFIGCLLLAVIALNLLLGWIPLLGHLVVTVVLVPVVSTALWLASRQVFGSHGDSPPGPPPVLEV
jgi:uncharacterized membrane protein